MTTEPPSVKEQIQQLTNGISVKKGVHFAVENTNSILATLEQSSNTASSFASSRLRPLWYHVKKYTQMSMQVYQQREYYGPQIVLGSATAVGMLVSLRRGKVPGAITGTVMGLTSYGGVYGFPKP
jgi:hypothetical protein